MALSISIGSIDLPIFDGHYYVEGNRPVPMIISVYNDNLVNSVQLRKLYLTQDEGAITTGMPEFRYISTSNPTTNNIIPPDSTVEYPVLWIPQTDALQVSSQVDPYPALGLGNTRYNVNLRAIGQVWGETTMYRGAPQEILVYPSPNVSYTAVSPISLWSLHDNIRPAGNSDFDILVGANQILNDCTIYLIPQSELYFSSSDTGVCTVIAHSDGNEATTDNNSQAIGGGGAVSIVGIGPATISIRRWANSGAGTLIASTTITVVDALPQTLSISPALTSINWVNSVTNSIRFKALLTKTNGVVENVSASPDINWRINGLLYGDWAYFIDVVGNNRSKLFLSNDNNELNPYSATSGIITATYSPSYTITGQANILVRKTV